MFLEWAGEIVTRKSRSGGPSDEQDREIFVSPLGNDSEDGLSRETAVRTVTQGISRLRDGHNDWLLLMPGLHPQFPESLVEGS